MKKERLATVNAVLWMTCLILAAALVTIERDAPDPSDPVLDAPPVRPIRSEPRTPPPAMQPQIVLVADGAADAVAGPGMGRDPFQPPEVVIRTWKSDEGDVVSHNACLGPGGGALTSFDLSDLRLEGIAQMPPVSPHALIASPNGRGFILRVGDVVGRECARIVRIDAAAVSFRVGVEGRAYEVKKHLHVPAGLPI